MENIQLGTIYSMVCNTPKGADVTIDYMPSSFENDVIDNDKPHVHSFYEIIWFTEGEGKHMVDFNDYDVEKNMLLFLSPGQVHHFDNAMKYKGVLIKFCTDFLIEETTDNEMSIKYSLFNSFDTPPYGVVSDDVAEKLKHLLELIKEEQSDSESNKLGHVEMLRSLIRVFLITVQRNCRRHEDASMSGQKSSQRLYLQFRKTLEKNYKSCHTVGEYAFMLNVSPKTLSNCTLECSGKTPLTLINDRIVLEAKRLLRYSNLITKEIADYLGFDDPSYFTKFFKRQTGYQPSLYREG